METGSSLTRALIEAQRQQCDVINMSYADVCAVPNRGRFVELAEELVWKHNIIYVGAAGNSGPALSSVSTPGGTSTAMLGVAAHVSPEMAKILYGLPLVDAAEGEVVYEGGGGDSDGAVERFPGTTYTWSSVGPATDGHQGIVSELSSFQYHLNSVQSIQEFSYVSFYSIPAKHNLELYGSWRCFCGGPYVVLAKSTNDEWDEHGSTARNGMHCTPHFSLQGRRHSRISSSDPSCIGKYGKAVSGALLFGTGKWYDSSRKGMGIFEAIQR
jgi:Subtilase family